MTLIDSTGKSGLIRTCPMKPTTFSAVKVGDTYVYNSAGLEMTDIEGGVVFKKNKLVVVVESGEKRKNLIADLALVAGDAFFDLIIFRTVGPQIRLV